MKILYFHQYFNTPRAAGGTRSYEMALQLIASGHQVTMVCVKSGKGDLELPGKPNDSVRKGWNGSVTGPLLRVLHCLRH